jgi:hypothetical protein
MGSSLNFVLGCLNLLVGVLNLAHIKHSNTMLEYFYLDKEDGKDDKDAVRRKNERVALIEEHLVYGDMK